MEARRIRQGDIFWLDDCRPLHGDLAKRRPVVVLSPDDSISKQPDVLVVACTSTVYPSNKTAIELPSRERTPQTRTGLNRRTWAVPEWLVTVESNLLVDRAGRITGATLRRLLEAVTKTRQ
ncbi:MAG TPA: type II toxin-antitoxin system PemK/MazF family toxin [Humisphaera sp.]|nr:type II toxin-antitoxin system PemK/MazF family toxin [Humisphaera sp.]